MNELKLNKICKAILYLIVINLCLRLTILINYDIVGHILYILIALFIVLFFLCNYKKIDISVIKKNLIFLVYLGIRIFTIIVFDRGIPDWKNLFYESFFLILVTNLYNYSTDKKVLNNIVKIIVIVNLVINIITLLIEIPKGIDFTRKNFYGLYTNPNALAIFTGISLIFFISYLKKNCNNALFFIYFIFSLMMIILSQARTEMLCISIFIFLKLLHKFFKRSEKRIKKVSIFILLISIISIPIISYVNKNNYVPTEFETNLNDITTNRYYLWKYSIYSLENNPVFGIGNDNIGNSRFNQLNEATKETIGSNNRILHLKANNNHNGYIQLLVANGIICFLIVLICLIRKTYKLEIREFDIVIYIQFINLFENQLIMTQSICVFMLFFIISTVGRVNEKNAESALLSEKNDIEEIS